MENSSLIKINYSEINFKNSTPIYSLNKNRLSINSIDFKDELFLISSDDSTIEIYEIIKGINIFSYSDSLNGTFNAHFLKRNDTIIYTTKTDYSIILYDYSKKKYLFQMFSHLYFINEINYNRINNILITKDDSGLAYIWSISSFQDEIFLDSKCGLENISSCVIDYNGENIYSVKNLDTYKFEIMILNVNFNNDNELYVKYSNFCICNSNEKVKKIKVSNDNNCLIVLYDYQIDIFDLSNKKELNKIKNIIRKEKLLNIEISPDSKMFIVTNEFGKFLGIFFDKLEISICKRLHYSSCKGVKFSEKYNLFATYSDKVVISRLNFN